MCLGFFIQCLKVYTFAHSQSTQRKTWCLSISTKSTLLFSLDEVKNNSITAIFVFGRWGSGLPGPVKKIFVD